MERGKTLFTVQALRALAASSVFVHHILIVAVQKAGYRYTFPSTAAAGVPYTHFDDFAEAGIGAFTRNGHSMLRGLF
jgi:peptidoglycan/LPS O-acetylase OafA/YrhL